VEELKARSRHSGVTVLTKAREHLPLDSQDRDRLVKDSLSDKSSEGQDLFALTYDDSGWCMAIPDKLEKHTTSGARPASAWDCEHTSGEAFTA
jgi:hypothetical protein